MISYNIYKVLHLLGLWSLFFAYGGILVFYRLGHKPGEIGQKALSIIHGLSLLVILLGGFGMLARLGIHWPWPTWLFIKLVVWFALGGLIVVARRKPQMIWPLYGILILLAFVGLYSVLYKPFL